VEKSAAEREREAERERDRHSPFSQRHLHTHHHTHVGMGYPLIPGQYDPFQGEQKVLSDRISLPCEVVALTLQVMPT